MTNRDRDRDQLKPINWWVVLAWVIILCGFTIIFGGLFNV